MKATYNFGKIAYTSDRRINAVEVELRLEEKAGVKCFSAVVSVWDSRHTDWVAGGQMLDALMRFPELSKNPLYCEIHDLWKEYHLNDMHAGTPKQEAALKTAVEDGKLAKYGANNYEETCEYLESVGLLEDKDFLVERNGKQVPYKYGTGWLVEPIPEADLARIEDLIENVKEYSKPVKKNIERE